MTLGAAAQVDEHAANIISVTVVDNQQNTEDAVHSAPGLMTTADSLLSVAGESTPQLARAANTAAQLLCVRAMLCYAQGYVTRISMQIRHALVASR